METTIINTQFTNAQVEILKMFSFKMENEDILKLKQVFQNFLIKKLDNLTDDFWDKNNLDDTKMEALLNKHERIPYKSKYNKIIKQN